MTCFKTPGALVKKLVFKFAQKKIVLCRSKNLKWLKSRIQRYGGHKFQKKNINEAMAIMLGAVNKIKRILCLETENLVR